MDYETLEAPAGTHENMGGTTSRAYIGALADFLSIKTPVPAAGLDTLVEITTDHTFIATKCFKKMYCTQNKGEVNVESAGEIDGRSFKAKVKLFYPGNKAQAAGFAKQAKNDSFIILVEHPDSADNGYSQVGTEMFPAKFTGKWGSATNESGVRGWEFEFECPTPAHYIYTGAVTLTPAP
jgi:hypothetical protein